MSSAGRNVMEILSAVARVSYPLTSFQLVQDDLSNPILVAASKRHWDTPNRANRRGDPSSAAQAENCHSQRATQKHARLQVDVSNQVTEIDEAMDTASDAVLESPTEPATRLRGWAERLNGWAKRLNISNEATIMWVLAFREALAINNDNDLMRAQQKQATGSTALHVRTTDRLLVA